MQKSILILFFLLSTAIINAKDKKEPETLFSGESHVTGYGCPELKFTQINGDWGIMLGGRGGVIVDKTLSIGGAAYLLLTSHKVKDYKDVEPNQNIYIRTLYGGFVFEYINSSDKVVHFTVNSLVGAGIAGYTESIYCNQCNTSRRDWLKEISGYFVVEPGITIDLNVTTFFRISMGGSYRFVSGLNLKEPITNKELSGPSLNLAFKWGGF